MRLAATNGEKTREREGIVLKFQLGFLTLPLAYHLEFSVFFAKWYATLSGLSISMSFFATSAFTHVTPQNVTIDAKCNNF